MSEFFLKSENQNAQAERKGVRERLVTANNDCEIIFCQVLLDKRKMQSDWLTARKKEFAPERQKGFTRSVKTSTS